MKKYMVISVIEGEQGTAFFDDYMDTEQHKQDVECGMGGIAYVYALNDNNEYEFIYC